MCCCCLISASQCHFADVAETRMLSTLVHILTLFSRCSKNMSVVICFHDSALSDGCAKNRCCSMMLASQHCLLDVAVTYLLLFAARHSVPPGVYCTASCIQRIERGGSFCDVMVISGSLSVSSNMLFGVSFTNVAFGLYNYNNRRFM